MATKIPYKVQELASSYLKIADGEVSYIGIYEGLEMYLLSFQDDDDTGFPILFSWDKMKQEVRAVEPFEALRISGVLIKD